MLAFDYTSIISNKYPGFLRDSADWLEWRYAYEGGRVFRDRYLQMFSERENGNEFIRRRELTPIPAYAKREINRVKNGLMSRFSDIVRRGGSTMLQDAIAGNMRGVDMRGASINSFVSRHVLPDLLVMGRIGVLVDAPRVTGETKADVPAGWKPYIYCYPVEQIPLVVEQDIGKPGDFKSVLVVDKYQEANYTNGIFKDFQKYRYYTVDETTGKVAIQMLDANGKETEELIRTELTEIPFVMFDIGDSLIKDVCRHQIALLNLISSDTSYAVDSNFPFLTRQRGNANAGEHLKGENATAEVGTKKGLFFEKGMERPGFISPSIEPMTASLALRKELKEEVRELVSGAIADMGEDGSIDAGLAFIGATLEDAENRLWDHWTAYESTDEAGREKPTIKYPDHWCIKPEKERIEEANELAGTMYKVPGRMVKKEIAKLVADKLLRGRVTTEVLDKIHKEIDDAPYCTSDPEIIIPAKKQGAMSGETACLALGGDEKEYAKAKADQAERAAVLVAAQADAAKGAARGNPDGSVDPASSEGDKELESDPSTKLGGDGDAGVRGEGATYGDDDSNGE